MLWVSRQLPYHVWTGEPLWWYAKFQDRKLGAHLRVWLARWRRRHQRFVSLSIRLRITNAYLKELLAPFEEYETSITDPEAILSGALGSTETVTWGGRKQKRRRPGRRERGV